MNGFSWERYPAIKRVFGEQWLNDPRNKDHPLFQVYEDGANYYLKPLDKYLESHLESAGRVRKTTANQLKNREQFFDIYYEFEIVYFLRKHGLRLKLHEIIRGKETDIFVEEENVVIAVTHLHIPNKIKNQERFVPKEKVHPISKGVDSTFLNMKRMQRYINQKRFQDVYPNIVCFCPQIAAGECHDLENLLRKEKVDEKVSALAIWRDKEILCFFENPNGKKLEWKSSMLKNFFKQN